MTKFVQIAGLLLASIACTSLSANDAPDNPGAEGQQIAEAKTTKKVKEDKVVCKKIRVTGTHFKKRICQKRSVWKEMEEESQRAMDELSTGRSTNTGS